MGTFHTIQPLSKGWMKLRMSSTFVRLPVAHDLFVQRFACRYHWIHMLRADDTLHHDRP